MQRFYLKFLILVFTIFISSFCFAQLPEDLKIIQQANNKAALQEIAEEYSSPYTEVELEQLAKDNGWDFLKEVDGSYQKLHGISSEGEPIYYETYNQGAGITARTNKLYSGGGLGLSLHGQNMNIALWDVGSVRPNHELYNGRLFNVDVTSVNHHSTHVAGTLIGTDAVQNGAARGMASEATADSYTLVNDIAEVANAAANGLLVSNHSYGYILEEIPMSALGKYDNVTSAFDNVMYNAPHYLFVCAAGNSRTGNFNPAKNGYDLITGHGLAKNGMTVAAVHEVLDYTGPESVEMSIFSSWGPCDDGRIKPDISAKGVDTFSSTNAEADSYWVMSGTSMASPSVAGTLLLLQQYYHQQHSMYMRSATLKGLAIHTADEAGDNDGPDYSFGWGLMNAEKAANVITNEENTSLIIEGDLLNNGTYTASYPANNLETLVATLSWTDPSAPANTQGIDDPTPALINDLDIKIMQNGVVFYPWKLDVSNPANAATTGDNTVDNIEKIEIPNASGVYDIVISHKGTLTNTHQQYSLILSGIYNSDFSFDGVGGNEFSLCNSIDTNTLTFNVNRVDPFATPIQLSTENLPSGVSAALSLGTLNTEDTFTVDLSGISSLAIGDYSFVLKGTAGTDVFELPIQLHIYESTIVAPTLTNPTDTQVQVDVPFEFTWNADPNAEMYHIQIASNDLMTDIIEEVDVETNSYSSDLLDSGFTYYWRVQSINPCGSSTYSSTYSFDTTCPNEAVIEFDYSISTEINANIVDANNSDWVVAYVPEGSPAPIMGDSQVNTQISVDNLNPDTCYDFYIQNVCDVENASWNGPYTFCTSPDYCGGSHFYDTGGAASNYMNNELYSTTIYPENGAEKVRVIFNTFDVEAGWDFLKIFDGPNTSSNLIGSYTGNNSPGDIVSTHPTGTLTFEFDSDGFGNTSGWDATIICESLSVEDIDGNDAGITLYPNPVTSIMSGTSSTLEIESVLVYDVSGALLEEQKVNGHQFELNMNTYKTNTYLIQLKLEDGSVENRKIIKR